MNPYGAPQYPDPRQVPPPHEEYRPPFEPATPRQLPPSWYASWGYPPPQPVTNVYMQKPPFNHFVHLVLDFVTCFLWTPIHILLWILHDRR